MKEINVDIQAEAINLVREEIRQWEDALVPITPRVYFKMRSLIETLRKNYWGVFDKPIDPTTGRKKVWIPLTESITDAVVKNIDLDQKDIQFRAKNENGRKITDLTRALVRNWLDSEYFGETLDAEERTLAIDGTIIWKTLEVDKKPKRISVDLLNAYIDPTADSIKDAYRFTERCLYTPHEVKKMDGWINTDVEGQEGLPRTSPESIVSARTTKSVKLVDVYEMWGLIPKRLITGSKEDDEEVEGRVVVSGLDGGGTPRVHLIEENKGVRPYTECRYSKVAGRFYGRGVAEKVMMLQLWMNTIVNIRINRSYVSQLGLFKIRRGSGVTPQMLSGLPANGAITVNNMDDIEQFVMTEASQASYQDEENIMSWATRLTSAFEVVTGEGLPSSTPATNAVLQDRNAKTQFGMVKEQIGIFLQRWINEQVLPILAKNLDKKQIIRVSSEDDIKGLVERVVAFAASEELDLIEAGFIGKPLMDPMEVDSLMLGLSKFQQKVADAEERLRKEPELFFEMLEDIIVDDIDTKVFVTNEELDIAVTVRNALDMAAIAPEYRTQLIKDAADMMGIQLQEPMQPMMMPGMDPMAQESANDPFAAPSGTEETIGANLPSLV